MTRPTNFVDIGSGQGKACFYAATTGLFKSIVGVEFDETLIRESNTNLTTFTGKQNIQFVHMDATEYRIGSETSFIFMFNPFNGEVLDIFLRNNFKSFIEAKHVLGYVHDDYHPILEKIGFSLLYRESYRNMSLWQFP